MIDFEINDIEKSEIVLKDFKPNSKIYLIYNNNQLSAVNSVDSLKNIALEEEKSQDNKDDYSNFSIVSEITYIPTLFRISNPLLSPFLRRKITDISNLCRSWRPSKKNEENIINKGDIIKLGRVRLKIDTICIGEIYESSLITNTRLAKNKSKTKVTIGPPPSGKSKIANNININTNLNVSFGESHNNSMIEDEKINKITDIKDSQKNIEDFSKKSSPACRICYLTCSEVENPLIKPCKCSGSMANIHYKCLKKCIEMNINKKLESGFKFYSWKNYECEICKAEYPKYIRYKESIYPLVDMEVEYSSYIICDFSLYDDVKKQNFRRGIIAIKVNDTDEDTITIGRSQNNRVKLKDISVSRYHCNIIKRKNKLYIVDKGSKFGTLIYLNNPLNLTLKNNEQAIISGRHWVSFALQEQKSFFARLFPIRCCECNEVKNKADLDVEHLEDNNEKSNSVSPEKIMGNEKEVILPGEELDNNVVDNSYQDLILDLGNNIYVHQMSENEDNK